MTLSIDLSADPRLSTLLLNAERRWGRGALVRGGEIAERAAEEAIPTGFPTLDEALGIGGLPCGRLTEIFGPDSSGKHALVAHLVVQCQRLEGVVAYVDMARRLDPEQMGVQGVDFRTLLVARPRSYLQGLELAIRLARSGGVKLLVLDLTGDGEMGRRGDGIRADVVATPFMGARNLVWQQQPFHETRVGVKPTAAALDLALRRLVATVDKNGIAFLFLSNSLFALGAQDAGRRARKDVGHGLVPCRLASQEHPSSEERSATRHSTGGQALRFFASVRLGLERNEWIYRGRDVVGCRTFAQTVKNKLAPPLRYAEIDLLFRRFPPEVPPAENPSGLLGPDESL